MEERIKTIKVGSGFANHPDYCPCKGKGYFTDPIGGITNCKGNPELWAEIKAREANPKQIEPPPLCTDCIEEMEVVMSAGTNGKDDQRFGGPGGGRMAAKATISEELKGLSTDIKPINVPNNTRYLEKDTKLWYIFINGVWYRDLYPSTWIMGGFDPAGPQWSSTPPEASGYYWRCEPPDWESEIVFISEGTPQVCVFGRGCEYLKDMIPGTLWFSITPPPPPPIPE